jgi:hypothetical protein
MHSRTRNPNRLLAALGACVCCLALADPGSYSANFSNAEVGKAPPDVQVVSGAFAVAEFNGERVLELPGEPLDTFGLLFGPAAAAEVTVGARVFSETSGRRFPEFGIGAGDIGGYKLMLLPGQKRLELRRGDDPVAIAPYTWASGAWTELRLRIQKTDAGSWIVEGKAWLAGKPEPQAWPVSAEEKQPPAAGRASVWGIPFSGKPIRFNDLTIAPPTK